MRIKFKVIFVLVAVFSILLVGCGKKSDVDDAHYKPSEYKHDSAISNAGDDLKEVNDQIITISSLGDVEKEIVIYDECIDKLEIAVSDLESGKESLKDETDLTNSEIRNWNKSYDSKIDELKENIEDLKDRRDDAESTLNK